MPAKACDLLGVTQVVPIHDGTFPELTEMPARLRELVEPRGVEALAPQPGDTFSQGLPAWEPAVIR